jgi:hypothetical protein
MARVVRSTTVVGDQLLLAGHVLQALESGRMCMHAADYLEISAWVTDELSLLATDALYRIHRRVPGPIQDIVENLLHARAEVAWTSALFAAAAEWASLLESL